MNKKEKEEVNDLKLHLEYCKKQELLAAIFFDGEHREKINFWKQKRKEVEKRIAEIEE